ncbi:MAG TPA: sterol desaturase family protein [Caulobacteraceae bacterium]|jgi:sterol desaturase/sphingolipid hydroxylase (fatty acid hydroxylase superfamily)|nr:sterol desaturase family protein [Caulobacteraceae bacterium]
MSQVVLAIARSCAILAIVVVVFAPLERLFPVRRQRLFHPGWAIDVGWYFLNSLTLALLLGPPAALLAFAVHAALPAAVTGAAAGLPLWARMVLAVIVAEFGFYWGHRWSHEWPLLWRFHSVHHSATHLSFLANARAHPVDVVFTRLCGLVLLYATGLASAVGPHPSLLPAAIVFVSSLWSYFIHANLRWRFGRLEALISTPAFHHWHHRLAAHGAHNFAPMLPVLDRLFGTLHPPREWPAAYGVAAAQP